MVKKPEKPLSRASVIQEFSPVFLVRDRKKDERERERNLVPLSLCVVIVIQGLCCFFFFFGGVEGF